MCARKEISSTIGKLVVFVVLSGLTGGTEVCQAGRGSRVAVGLAVSGPAQCEQFCSLTAGCRHWTWYSQHCDTPPCQAGPHTRQQVCYALSACRRVTQRCGDCGSGSLVSVYCG